MGSIRIRSGILAIALAAVAGSVGLGDEPKKQDEAATATKAQTKAAAKKAAAKAAAKKADQKAAGPKAETPIDLEKLGRPARAVKAPTITPADIDARLEKMLASSGVEPVETTNDDEFFRRLYLDLIGRLPTPEQIVQFRTNRAGRTTKRGQAIDQLLASPDFGKNWGAYWKDVIASRATNQNAGRVQGYAKLEDWMADQLNKNRPWDEIAAALITATGKYDENGATGLMLAHAEGNKAVEAEIAGEVARIFLGIQIQCAECHNHPSDQWKREQFHGFASFFAGIRARTPGKDDAVVENTPRAGYAMTDLKDPQKKTPVEPQFFLETSSANEIPKALSPANRRALAASFVTGQDNPWFARAFINRLWLALMGQGFYTPVDDMGPNREAIASEILDELADQWQQGGYDVKWLYRTLLNTKAYQRRVRSTFRVEGRTSFAANTVSRLRAEPIVDNLESVLGTKFGGGRGPRALFNADPSTPSDEVQGTIPQALFLMNDPKLNGAITGKKSLAAQTVAHSPNDEAAITAIYLKVLARRPTEKEGKVFFQYLHTSRNKVEAYEDLVWALVNSAEFQSRH